MTWVIVRASDKKYVSVKGSLSSYTTKLESAEKFSSYENAKANCCGNEYPVDLSTTVIKTSQLRW